MFRFHASDTQALTAGSRPGPRLEADQSGWRFTADGRPSKLRSPSLQGANAVWPPRRDGGATHQVKSTETALGSIDIKMDTKEYSVGTMGGPLWLKRAGIRAKARPTACKEASRIGLVELEPSLHGITAKEYSSSTSLFTLTSLATSLRRHLPTMPAARSTCRYGRTL